MTETMNFGPEWMKNSSGANQSSGPVLKTPTTPTTPISINLRKFALAEFRYGKEDILALYAENLPLSVEILESVSLITSEVFKPMAFLPFAEEEQLLFAGCVNSHNSLRLAGRGSGPPLRGGRGGRGRGRGRGGSDGGGYYHRSYSYDEQITNADYFNRPQMDGSNRGGYEYGRGRGGARSNWTNNWRDASSVPSEEERRNIGLGNRWPLPSPGAQHPGRTDSGWRNRDESKKGSLLPEWAQQDSPHATDGSKTPQKDNGGSHFTTSDDDAQDRPNEDVDDQVINRSDTNLSEKHLQPQSDILAAVQEDSSTTVSSTTTFPSHEPLHHKAEDRPARTFADNKKITPLNAVANNPRHPMKKDSSPSVRSKSTGEEPFSPDGFTHFEKAAEDLLLTEEEDTPSTSPVSLTGRVVNTANPSTANNTVTFTSSHTPLHSQNASTQPAAKQMARPTTLPTSDQHAVEEFFTWYYQDPDGLIQGAFTSGEMKEWFDAGYFTMDLMVQRACDSHMLPLGQVIQMWKRIPFVTEGKQPPPVKVTEPFWQPLMQQQPLLFQQRHQQQQQQPPKMTLQQTHAPTATSDLTSTAESIWGRGTVPEKAPPSTQWPQIESVWEQSKSSPQENYDYVTMKQQQQQHEEEARRLEQEKRRQEQERQRKAEEERQRKVEEAQKRLEEEFRLKQKQEMEAKAAKERQERERLRLLEEERRRQEKAELERESLRQQEQERLAEWKRNEEAKRFQQQLEDEKKLKALEQASMEATQDQKKMNMQAQAVPPQQQHVWSVMGSQSAVNNVMQPAMVGGASLLLIQQQEEARMRKQQQLREQQIRAQMAAIQQAQMASAGWTASKGMATSPSAGKSFLEIQLEQQKTATSNPPPVQKNSSSYQQFGSVWNNPGTISSGGGHPATQLSSGGGHPTTQLSSGGGGVWQNQPAVQQRLPRNSESDDDFWDLCMKDIPAAHRPSGGGARAQTKPATAKVRKVDKHEERIRSLFATPTASDDLIEWCEAQFSTIQTELDAATFVTFLLQFESPYEVHDYVKLHIGDSAESKEFTKQYLEKAKQCKQQVAVNNTSTSGSSSSIPQVTKSKLVQQPQHGYPLPSSTVPSKSSIKHENTASKPATGAAVPVGSNGGGKKKKKGKMQKVNPASILGFSVNAADRPNAGEIQGVHDVVH